MPHAYFDGNAPRKVGQWAFRDTASGFTVYFRPGAQGFTAPLWNGYPAFTALGFGIGADKVMRISGIPNASIQVLYADSLGTNSVWKPLTNFTMPSSDVELADPTAAGMPYRFYRAVSQ